MTFFNRVAAICLAVCVFQVAFVAYWVRANRPGTLRERMLQLKGERDLAYSALRRITAQVDQAGVSGKSEQALTQIDLAVAPYRTRLVKSGQRVIR